MLIVTRHGLPSILAVEHCIRLEYFAAHVEFVSVGVCSSRSRIRTEDSSPWILK